MTNDARSSVPSTIVLETVNEGGQYSTRSPKQGRTTQAEQELRITQIFRLLIEGVPRHGILQYVATQTTWGLSKRSVDKLIADARERIHAIADTKRKTLFGVALIRLDEQYSLANAERNRQAAVMAVRAQIELVGLKGHNEKENRDEQDSLTQFKQDREAILTQLRLEAERAGVVFDQADRGTESGTTATQESEIRLAGTGESESVATARSVENLVDVGGPRIWQDAERG